MENEFIIRKYGNQETKIFVKDGYLSLGEESAEYVGIENLTTLRTLYLDEFDIKNDIQFEIPKTLEKLYLHKCIDEDGDFPLKFPNLTVLKVAKMGFNMSKIKRLANLIELEVDLCYIDKIEDLSSLTELKMLSLFGNQISKIEGVNNLKNLERLNLGDNKIEKIENLENLRNLQYLNLSHNKIKRIENLDSLIYLKRLNLAENQIEGMSGLKRLINLEELEIRNNPKLSDSFLTFEQVEPYLKSLWKLKKLNDVAYPESEKYRFWEMFYTPSYD